MEKQPRIIATQFIEDGDAGAVIEETGKYKNPEGARDMVRHYVQQHKRAKRVRRGNGRSKS